MKSAYRIEWYGLVKPSDYLFSYAGTYGWHVYDLLNKNGSYELFYKGQYYLIENRLSPENKLLVTKAIKNKRYKKKFPLMRRAVI